MRKVKVIIKQRRSRAGGCVTARFCWKARLDVESRSRYEVEGSGACETGAVVTDEADERW